MAEVLTFWLNGLLAFLYWLADHWAALTAFLVALATIALVDEPLARQAGDRPGRYGRSVYRTRTTKAYLPTFGLALAWLVAAWITPAPVPFIGLAMWIVALVTPLAMPLGKRYLVHRARWFIGVYTALVTAFLFVVRRPLAPQQAAAWSEHLQAAGAGEALDWAIRSQFVPYLALLIWAIVPLTYFGYILQQLAVQRRLLVAPWNSASDLIAAMRARGE